MRVVVATDSIGPLSSAVAGRAIAAGWSDAQTLVVPVGEAGAGFVTAARDAVGERGGVVVAAAPGPGVGAGTIPSATSRRLGLALADALHQQPRAVWLDLVSDDVHDGGAGLLSIVSELPAGVELIGVVPSEQRDRPLLGLRGITSLRGRGAGEDPSRLLGVDAELGRLAARLGVADADGAGACGGVGLAVIALGGRLATGPELLLEPRTDAADLVVSGCSSYDFASRGGGVVAAAAAFAERRLCPCIVLAGEVLIGGREMRTMGVEAAYALHPGPAVSAARLQARATQVARSWHW